MENNKYQNAKHKHRQPTVQSANGNDGIEQEVGLLKRYQKVFTVSK